MSEIKNFRFLGLITGLFATLLITSNLASTRIIEVGWLEFDAGTLMFPVTYIFNDILTEVYGYAKSRRVIWTGFAALLISALCLYLVSLFPAAEGWDGAAAWDSIMGVVPRIVGASLVAYFAGEFINSFVLAKLKIKTKGRHLWLRLIGSTFVGQLFDTFIFASIAFIGVLDWPLWWSLVISNYIFKVGLEVILLPFTCLILKYIKKAEGVDTYDHDTKFSPFRWKE